MKTSSKYYLDKELYKGKDTFHIALIFPTEKVDKQKTEDKFHLQNLQQVKDNVQIVIKFLIDKIQEQKTEDKLYMSSYKSICKRLETLQIIIRFPTENVQREPQSRYAELKQLPTSRAPA